MALTKVSYSMITGSPVNVLDYGAKGDGVTNDSAAFQAALNTKKPVYVPYSALGYVVSGLQFVTGMSLYAENKQWIISSSSFAVIGESGGANTTDVFISNFVIDMRTASASSGAFTFATSLNKQFRIMIDNVDTVGAFWHSAQDADNINYTFDTTFNQCRAYWNRGCPFSFYNLQGFVQFYFCQADMTDDGNIYPIIGTITGPNVVKNFPGFRVAGTQTSNGVEFLFCSTHGRGGILGATSDEHGFLLLNVWSPILKNCYADTINGSGFLCDGIKFGQFETIDAFSCYTGGFGLSDSEYCFISNARLIGTADLVPPAGLSTQRGLDLNNVNNCQFENIKTSIQRGYAAVIYNSDFCQFTNLEGAVCGSGIYLDTVTDCTFSSVLARSISDDGLKMVDSQRNAFSSLTCISNTGYGRRDANSAATTNYNSYSSCLFSFNGLGNFVQLGTGSITSSYITNAGTAVANTIGAAVV